MQTALKVDNSAPVEERPLSERAQVFRRCKAAFEKIQKHGTPPDPIAYAIWYAYVARTPPSVAVAVDKLVASGRTLDSYELNEIYREFLTGTTSEEASEAIGKEFEDNMQSVSKLLESGVAQHEHFCCTLHDLGNSPETSSDEQDFKSLLSHLVEESQKMASVSDRLTKGLQESQERVKQLNAELERVRKQSLLDPLTSVANRRAFDDRMKWQTQESMSNGSSFCLVLADLDEFKGVNDRYGHQTGDEVLKSFATTLFEHTKGQDLVARYGGDEFAIILPNIDLMSAYNLMVSIKHKFEGVQLPSNAPGGSATKATASFGISAFQNHRRSVEDMIASADTSLHRAKTTGRNRVCAEGIS